MKIKIKHAIALLLLCVVCAGCGRKNNADAEEAVAENNPPRPHFQINPDEVSFIIFDGMMGSGSGLTETITDDAGTMILETHYEIIENFRITNRCEIIALVRDFNDLHKQPEGGVTWSGILSGQLFMSSNNNALASTAIIINKSSCVLVNTKVDLTMKDGHMFRVYYEDERESRDGLFSVSGHQYAATVLEVMKKYAPDEVKLLNDFTQKTGKSLEEALGID